MANLLQRLGCVTRQVESGDEALTAVKQERPALVVLDVDIAGTSGYEVCRELRDAYGEGLPIMFVSACRLETRDEIEGLLLGADAYLVKPINGDRFLAYARRLLARSEARIEQDVLTPREREVLELLVRGMRVRDIAAELCITPKTASTHIERIMSKLGAHSQAQVVAFAVRDRLLSAAA
jgi:DNA-binding NarL/FixJ family response regulator